jgi:hypothetical protein
MGTRHRIKPVSLGFSGFSLLKWLLDGVLFVLLIYIVLAKKTPRGLPDGSAASPTSAGGGSVLGL